MGILGTAPGRNYSNLFSGKETSGRGNILCDRVHNACHMSLSYLHSSLNARWLTSSGRSQVILLHGRSFASPLHREYLHSLINVMFRWVPEISQSALPMRCPCSSRIPWQGLVCQVDWKSSGARRNNLCERKYLRQKCCISRAEAFGNGGLQKSEAACETPVSSR